MKVRVHLVSVSCVQRAQESNEGHGSLFKRIVYLSVPVLPWQTPSHLACIYRSRAVLSTVPLFGFRTLQIGCLAFSTREFPLHSALPRASCMPATLLVWISLVCSSYPPGFPIEKILKLNSTTSRLEIPEILSCELRYSLSLAITCFTLGHFLFSCFSFFSNPPFSFLFLAFYFVVLLA